jgi:hypothetical protein
MRRLLSALLIIAIAGCGNPLPELANIDLKAWKDDKHACGNYREDNIESIRSQKEKLLALKESQIIELLGRPDRNELYKRNQKFFHYSLKADSTCTNAKDGGLRLVVRFNAMGLAKEVAIE